MSGILFAKIGSMVVATAVIVVICGGVSRADGKSIKYKATFSGSWTGDPNLSFDGCTVCLAYGNITGSDNIEGNFGAQDYTEINYFKPGLPCTAPDGTPGVEYPQVADIQVNNYPSGDQLYFAFSTGNECASLSTGSFSGYEDGTVVGGSGKFAHASGQIHASYAGSTLTPPASPIGFVAPAQATFTGNLTGVSPHD